MGVRTSMIFVCSSTGMLVSARPSAVGTATSNAAATVIVIVILRLCIAFSFVSRAAFPSFRGSRQSITTGACRSSQHVEIRAGATGASAYLSM
jgi:hypothetical protein